MNRRDFLKNTLALTAFGAVTRLTAQSPPGVADHSILGGGQGPKVTRRRYRDTAMTVPLLGYGLMRMPRVDPDRPDIDYAAGQQLIDRAMAAGVNYFDTAYMYHDGKSEIFAGEALKKYPRDSYYLADKMPVRNLRTEADIERIFNEQLKRCQVDNFDFYLLHYLNAAHWEIAQRLHVVDFLKKKQREGKIRLLGFSFHDEPEVLREITAAHDWDFAQIQLNYLDWELYRSKEQYEILTEAGIPVVVMEPLRGGALATLNPEAAAIFRAADPAASVASWSLRHLASLPNVLVILSGMTMAEHLEDNIKTMAPVRPLAEPERAVIEQALAAYRKSGAVPCTACRYCVPCPVGVDIPRVFGLYNTLKTSGNRFGFDLIYDSLEEDAKASACIACGVCKPKCPQAIDIPAELARLNADIGGQS